MRLLAVVLGGLGLVVSPAWGQPFPVSQQFGAAHEAYTHAQYEEAAERYRALLDSGHASAVLYHNLGNAYVRLNRTGEAVWAYERGRRLQSEGPRLQHNLEYIRRRAGLPQGGLPPTGLGAVVAGWSPLVLFGIGMLALCAGAFGAVVRVGPGRRVAWHAPIAWGPVGAGLLLVAVALGASYVQAQERRAVVVSEATPLRSAPADTASVDTTLRPGRIVEPNTKRDKWTRVRIEAETKGWIASRALKEI
ncbi:SH3 domain-containing protein [Salinibacter altiplanensis]|uniref:SH3 domain-containing protein n=1 Tax=Salinibacter altiplanensis TaxID=1803181 RepID=UPI00131A0045|nr:SH3 domain-containing protein [Salinibacter altiplanensis]